MSDYTHDSIAFGGRQVRSRKTVQDLMSAFNRFDVNGDGHISFEELKSVLSSIRMSVTEAEIHDTFMSIDTDGNGQIDFKEFVTLMSRELAKISELGKRMLGAKDSIRRLFKEMDQHYYGWITTSQFRQILDHPDHHLDDLTPAQKDLIVFYCDTDNNGKIDYKEFFTSFFAQHLAEEVEKKKRTTLRQVFVLTRHGTRFPLSPMPNNKAWPNAESFWKMYGGKLTPAGIKEHTKLGQRLRKWYMDDLYLFQDDVNFPNEIHCYTTNTDRTLFSASGLLNGFAPKVPQSYAVDSDREDQSYQGIRIHIADPGRKAVPVLHGYIGNKKYDAMKKSASEMSDFFKKKAEEPAVATLLEKLWEMTRHDRIPPEVPLNIRLAHMSPVQQQVDIERSLKMNVITNTSQSSLTPEDEMLMSEITDFGKVVKFQGNNLEQQRELARAAAGLLPATLVQSFKERIDSIENPREGKRLKKFVLYSGHDYTIMAVLAQLGIRNPPIPNFAAHIIAELHLIEGKYFVNLLYCDSPKLRQEKDQYFQFALAEDICDLASAPKGMMPFEFFEDILLNKRRSFKTEEEWAADAATDPDPILFPPPPVKPGKAGGEKKEKGGDDD